MLFVQIILFFALVPLAVQQNPPPTPIYTGNIIEFNSVQWATDSQSLAFVAADNGPYQQYHYDLADHTLTLTPEHPFAMTLSPEQQAQFEAVAPVAYPSPNGRYIVYEHAEALCIDYFDHCAPKIALADLTTGRFKVLETGLHYQRWFIWSAASNAVLMPVFAESLGGSAYIYNFSESVEQAEYRQLMSAQNGSDIHVALHPNGEQALLPSPQNRRTAGLFVWDASQLEVQQQFAANDSLMALADVPVAGAAFDLELENQLYAVTDVGIITLDWTAPESQIVLNASINADWVHWAYFSPDLQWIAVQPKPQNGFACQLYVLKVHELLDIDTLLAEAPRCSFYG